MKKQFMLIFLFGALICGGQDLFGQSDQMMDDQMSENQTTDSWADYNHWSVEINGGLNKPSRPFTESYYRPTFGPTENIGDWRASGSVDLGLRYMINNKFGLKLSGAYNTFKSNSGQPFETKYYYGVLEGVVNFGNILGFRDWTQTINLLLHGGAGPAHMQTGDDALYSDQGDNFAAFIVGLTPQIRLTDHLALNADLSIIGNVGMDMTWDGNTLTRDTQASRGFNGLVTTAKVGFTIYLGGDEKHVDWAKDSNKDEVGNRVDSLQNALADMEEKMRDTDQDGVPDYLDREPNTMNGVAVNSKGIAVDDNGNGIPDEIENSLDKRYQKASASSSSAGEASDIVKKLINDGYVNVFFKFNSSQPTNNSLDGLNYLKRYMIRNPEASAELIGYADEIGNDEYNQKLSKQRAERVKEILVSSGIEASRMSVTGKGSDDSVDKSSEEARFLVRRVKFELK
jgi:OOP family OmpA-OmpF porin